MSQRVVTKPSLVDDLVTSVRPFHTSQSMRCTLQGKRPLQRSPLCSCRPVRSGASTSWQLTTAYYERRDQHQPDCPWRQQAGTSWTFGFRTTVSAVLARSIRVAFKMDFGAGGFAIAPVLSAVRVVDRARSPAFAAIEAACSDALRLYRRRRAMELLSVFVQASEYSTILRLGEIYRKLHDDLHRLFSSGQASARDQTQEGATILHVSFYPSKAH